MKFDLDRVLLIVASVALAPVVADCVRKNVSIFAEARSNDAAAHFRVALEAVLGVFVPEVEGTVRAGGGEGAVLWVERNGVYGEDLGGIAIVGVGLAVALEGKVQAGDRLEDFTMYGVKNCERLPGVLVLNVLDGASTFNGANSETSRICEAADDSCLPLERTGNGLVDCRWVGQINHVDVALCRRNDKQLILDIHAVDALLTLQSTDGFGALQVPELYRLVP